MNTVLQIIRESGGFHSGKSISIENEPRMRRPVEVFQNWLGLATAIYMWWW